MKIFHEQCPLCCRSRHSNAIMTSLPIFLASAFLVIGNFFHIFFYQHLPQWSWSLGKIYEKTFSNYYFGMKFLWLETQLKLDNLNVRLLPLDKRNTFEMLFHLVSSLLSTCERSWGLLSPIVKKDCFNWAVFNANYDNLTSIIMRACRKKFVENF